MTVEPFKHGEQRRTVEGKGDWITCKCVNPNCHTEQDIFSPYKYKLNIQRSVWIWIPAGYL